MHDLLLSQADPNDIHPSVFIAKNATVVGKVIIGEHSSVWFGAVIRGDVAPIQIGNNSNIQDLVCLHADFGYPCTVGDRVTVGHSAIIHGATVQNDCLIGIRSIIMNGANIGEWSIIGAGAIVTEGKLIPPRSLVLGTPGKVVRTLTDDDFEMIRHGAEHYAMAAKQYILASPGIFAPHKNGIRS